MSVAFHVELAEGWTKSAHAYDLTEEELRERFLDPQARAEAVWLGGEGYDLSSLKVKLQVREGPPTAEMEDLQPAFGTEWLTALAQSEDVTNRFVTGPPGQPNGDAPAGNEQLRWTKLGVWVAGIGIVAATLVAVMLEVL